MSNQSLFEGREYLCLTRRVKILNSYTFLEMLSLFLMNLWLKVNQDYVPGNMILAITGVDKAAIHQKLEVWYKTQLH